MKPLIKDSSNSNEKKPNTLSRHDSFDQKQDRISEYKKNKKQRSDQNPPIVGNLSFGIGNFICR
jgi:hypothetical protein